jgi:RNA polymerase sigma-70 factor (ECF subfamily)
MQATLESPTYDQTELESLVIEAQAGDQAAFEQLVIRFEGVVFATAYRRLGNRADAQELCQEVFMQALRKLHQLQDPRCFGGWLRQITARMAINRAVRTKPMYTAEANSIEGDSVEYETPLSAMLSQERRSQVHQGLDRLRDLDRDTLKAFYFDGQSLVEMSDQFQSPVGTIKRRLHVARKRLAKELATVAMA